MQSLEHHVEGLLDHGARKVLLEERRGLSAVAQRQCDELLAVPQRRSDELLAAIVPRADAAEELDERLEEDFEVGGRALSEAPRPQSTREKLLAVTERRRDELLATIVPRGDAAEQSQKPLEEEIEAGRRARSEAARRRSRGRRWVGSVLRGRSCRPYQYHVAVPSRCCMTSRGTKTLRCLTGAHWHQPSRRPALQRPTRTSIASLRPG